MELQQVKNKSFLVKAMIGCASLVFLFLIVFATYILNLNKFILLHDIFVYAQSEFEPGAKAKLMVVVLNSKDAKPIEDAKIVIAIKDQKTKQGQVLYSGKTSAKGFADIQFDMPDFPQGDYKLIVKIDSQLGHDKIIKPIKLRESAKVLLTTDKSIYYSGQSCHIRALILKDSDATPIKKQEVTFEVRDSNWQKVFEKKAQTSEFGVVGITFILTDEMKMGQYTLKVSIGDYSVEKQVEVKEYVQPKFKVSFETDEKYYLPEQVLKGKIKATDMLGNPISNAMVKVVIENDQVLRHVFQVVNGKINEDGFFEFECPLQPDWFRFFLENERGRLFFNVSVTDQVQHTEEIVDSVPVANSLITVVLIPEGGTLVLGVENIIYIVTSYPDGKPVSTNIQVNGQRIKTNEFGIGEIKVNDIFDQNFKIVYPISANAQDGQENEGRITRNLPIRVGGVEKVILLRTDKSILEVGDTVSLKILSSQRQGIVYLYITKNKQLILSKALNINNGVASLELDLNETMLGVLELHAYKVFEYFDIVEETKTIFVKHKKDMQVVISADRDTYQPGELARISLMTTEDSKGIPSSLGVNITDGSAFTLHEEESDFERLHLGLQKEKVAAWSMIYGLTFPEYISKSLAVMDARTRTALENILMAGIQAQDPSLLSCSLKAVVGGDYGIRMSDHLNVFFSIIVYAVIFIFLSTLILIVYSYRNKQKKLLKDFGLGFLLWFSGGLLFYFLMVIIILVMSECMHIRPELLQNKVIWVFILVYFFSWCILARYAKRNDPTLSWVNIFSLGYVAIGILICARIFIGDASWYWDSYMRVHSNILKVFFVSYMFAIIYAKYALGFIKKRKGLAVLTLLMALILPLVSTDFYIRMKAPRQKLPEDDVEYAYTSTYLKSNWQFYKSYFESNIYDLNQQTFSGNPPVKEQRLKTESVFLETLYSNPQIITDQNGRATIEVKMPDSKTSLRLTAVANSPDGNVASNDLLIQVK